MEKEFWKTKLFARIHDPGEKALVLLRDPAGHEGGTLKVLEEELFCNDPIYKNTKQIIKRADWWAAAADRPQFPKENPQKTIVRWTKRPVLIHPLSGKEYDLKTLAFTDLNDIKSRSLDHYKALIQRQNNKIDFRNTYLAFWRFGPELFEEDDNEKLGHLWQQLPADTRVPDHSIWDHLDLTSAFAGAFSHDQQSEGAILILTIGPVQPFISAARSITDLWAGSHLLSYLSWTAMKTVSETIGPDSIIFPRLRGVPLVDYWLLKECNLPETLFTKRERTLMQSQSRDNNSLFRAALPNRFVAIVPFSLAEKLANSIQEELNNRILEFGNTVVDRLFQIAKIKLDRSEYAREQVREQIRGFPEVNWTVVPFSLVHIGDKKRQTQLDISELQQAMAPFFGSNGHEPCGFLAEDAWQILQNSKHWDDGTKFFDPNPGVLYPAIYDLAERVLAATKNTRRFNQTKQFGWRCSLTGETEWLTHDKNQLCQSYRNRNDTLWAKVAKKRPALAKKGEHLGTLPAIKRLWSDVFNSEVLEDEQTHSFVVSTHTMALAKHLKDWLETGGEIEKEDKNSLEDLPSVALPRALMKMYSNHDSIEWAKRIPSMLDELEEESDEYKNKERIVKRILCQNEKENFQIERYYSLLLMDGDNMGSILAGGEDSNCAMTYKNCFHPDIRNIFDKEVSNEMLKQYADSKRAISPGRHIAISSALNDFALHVVPEIVEQQHLGRVIYAGGDDVLAMLPVSDLLTAMQQLHCAYSGINFRDESKNLDIKCDRGFVRLKSGNSERLMRMMGEKATISCGAVIAHHRAPLSVVLRELRQAERKAKIEGGRDAYGLVVVKRSGGKLALTLKWNTFQLFMETREFISRAEISRRAIYDSLIWLKDLPQNAEVAMVSSLLFRQFSANSNLISFDKLKLLTDRLAEFACQNRDQPIKKVLENFLGIAEFMARESRR